MLRFALPSNDRLLGDTLDFLASCGLYVPRRAGRRLIERVRGVPDCEAVFLRPDDIPSVAEEGAVQLAIVGKDWFEEKGFQEGGAVVELIDDLGYGSGDLVLAVPKSVAGGEGSFTLGDLADWAGRTAEREGRRLRVATKYPHLTQKYLDEHGLETIVTREFQGSLESLPALGAVDLIADIVVTGATLEANYLMRLDAPPIVQSRVVLIGNVPALNENRQRRETLKLILEYVEAEKSADGRYVMMANVPGPSPEEVARRVLSAPIGTGLKGPTIARVYTKADAQGAAEQWYSVSLVIQHEEQEQVALADHLRGLGATGVIAFPLTHYFAQSSDAYRRFERRAAALGQAQR